jgi:1-acyl-sn-glycerol-3-phosphate acyltransferase
MFRKILNFIQAVLIAIWTGFCAALGMVLLLLTWHRRFVMLFMAYYIWSPIICAIAGVRVVGSGIENIDQKGKYIYVANHSSLFDIVAICRVSPVSMFYITKKELRNIPLMGQFIWLVGMLYIDRKNKDTAMKTMREAGKKIKAGRNIMSYPEGTRSKNGQVQVFKRGSFIIAKEAGIGVSPISIKGAFEVLSAGSVGLRSGTIYVHFHKPIQPAEFADWTVEKLSEKSREIVASRV